MNGRQAARLAANRIRELEYIVSMQSRDIREYNETILDIIAGKTPCNRCEEANECTKKEFGSVGCQGWWLHFKKPWEEGGDADGEAEGGGTGTDNSVLDMEEQ